MTKTMKWFRLYSEILHDRKLARIARHEQYPLYQLVGVWVSILCIANEAPERGSLMLGKNIPMTEDDIAFEIGMGIGDFQHLFAAFVEYEMIAHNGKDFCITSWNKRQFKSDDSSERVKRYREKKAKESVTLQKRYSNALDTDTDTDTDTENNDSDFGLVITTYENNITPITPIVSEKIQAAVDEFGNDDVIEAIGLAAKADVRKWNYINGILKSWRKDGKQKSKSTNGNKQSKPEQAEHLISIIGKYGRHKFSQAKPELEDAGMLPAVKRMGGWSRLCELKADRIKFAYYEAVKQ